MASDGIQELVQEVNVLKEEVKLWLEKIKDQGVVRCGQSESHQGAERQQGLSSTHDQARGGLHQQRYG